MSTYNGPTTNQGAIIEIDKDGDLVINITEHETIRDRQIFENGTGRESITTTTEREKFAMIRVDSSQLAAHSSSFKCVLNGKRQNGKKETITFNKDTIKSMELWFRLFHSELASDHIPSIQIVDDMAPWFVKWFYTKIDQIFSDIIHCRQMLFPCYYFNFANGFQVRLPAVVPKRLNASRQHFRKIIHKGLFSYLETIVSSSTCECKKQTVFNYLQELKRIKVWPLESTLQDTSACDMVERCINFDETNMSPGGGGTTRPSFIHCDHKWKALLVQIHYTVLSLFDGLCLDCMARATNPGVEEHIYVDDNDYDTHCRIRMGKQPGTFHP
ncbi:hypothetical protein PAAG_01422 [Paracoccidioides lutzii Pb01]|uniref:BTB domain-containing protein n=1 Tax=Paracoccidioides lutzii (strain ATCC MYA-826 / Pb01) TaxID=502779 RepID=C1GSC7_PARBA|nr:hypothetical protein PAAG_01422 [Paracoccidioides lutzii Pb01]EEH38960.1 hypothetical protein PAAG_01422 [Paracoccidioides lutzii Pb01]